MERVSVIIPTACAPERVSLLQRAIESALTQEEVSIELIVVVNGSIFDREYLNTLQNDTRLTVVKIEQPGAPIACYQGRKLATSDYFSFLDDDDEYLPNAIRDRLAILKQDQTIDFVATNGYSGNSNVLIHSNTDYINKNPMLALTEQNWLASCGGLYRSKTIDESFFKDLPAYMEWTFLAFKLLTSKKNIYYLNKTTYCINDTPLSLSKSGKYITEGIKAIEEIYKLDLPNPVRFLMGKKLLGYRHSASCYYLKNGKKLLAIKYHIMSMYGLYGLRYIAYTRYFFLIKGQKNKVID